METNFVFSKKKKRESLPHNSQRVDANTDAINNTTKTTHTKTTKDNQPQPNTNTSRFPAQMQVHFLVARGLHSNARTHDLFGSLHSVPIFSGVPTCCVICSACSSDRTQCASSCWHVSECTAIMIGRSSCPCQFVSDKRRLVLKH